MGGYQTDAEKVNLNRNPSSPEIKSSSGGRFDTDAEQVTLKTGASPVAPTPFGGKFETDAEKVDLDKSPSPVAPSY